MAKLKNFADCSLISNHLAILRVAKPGACCMKRPQDDQSTVTRSNADGFAQTGLMVGCGAHTDYVGPSRSLFYENIYHFERRLMQSNLCQYYRLGSLCVRWVSDGYYSLTSSENAIPL